MKSRYAVAVTALLLTLPIASVEADPGRQNRPAPVHTPRPDDDPCVAQGTCGQGDHGRGKAAIKGDPNCNAAWGEPDPLCLPIPVTPTSTTTCLIKATGGTPELSTVPPTDPTFEDVLLAEAHNYLEYPVTPGTYWLLFWNPTDGHSAQSHKVVCLGTDGSEEYTFIEVNTLPVY